jgi:hypothetical protein
VLPADSWLMMHWQQLTFHLYFLHSSATLIVFLFYPHQHDEQEFDGQFPPHNSPLENVVSSRKKKSVWIDSLFVIIYIHVVINYKNKVFRRTIRNFQKD